MTEPARDELAAAILEGVGAEGCSGELFVFTVEPVLAWFGEQLLRPDIIDAVVNALLRTSSYRSLRTSSYRSSTCSVSVAPNSRARVVLATVARVVLAAVARVISEPTEG